MNEPVIADLRRELEKACHALVDAQSHLSAHAHMNAALHCATEVFFSPLHAKVTAAIAGIEHALTRTAGGAHVYLSTGCLHNDHNYCKNSAGRAGVKQPARCKFCSAPCICTCHRAETTDSEHGVHPSDGTLTY